MRKFVYLSTFLSFLFFFSLSLCSPPKIFAKTFFYDNFEKSNANQWTPSSGDWIVSLIENSNQYGTIINTPSTTRENYAGDVNWQNYIYKVDMFSLAGEDKNLIFRVIDNNTKYGLHMRSDLAVLEIYDPKRGYFEIFNREAKFVNNTLYHLKVVINGENIKVYSNNNLLFDHTDTGTSITHGKIGLRVTTGAAYPSSVWFDNVIVCSLDDPCDSPFTPIVFIPGLGGSFNFNQMFLDQPGEWKVTPGTNIYKNIINAFKGNSDFHIFYYDWRKPVLDNVPKLEDFIKNTVAPWNNKVNLIGHSLGGLLARACVQETDDHCLVNKLITIGSPHLGVVEAYPALEAGEIWQTGVKKMAFELLIHYYQRPGETRRETLQKIAPVMNDLLPNFEYLYQDQDGSLIPWNTLSVQNPLLPQLSDLSKLENITATLYGRSYPTLNSLTLKETDALNKILGNWPDGEPVDRDTTPYEGDRVVLSLSAKLDNPNIEDFSFDLDHGGLISNRLSLEKAFSLINYELPIASFDSLDEEENYLVFFVRSPVKISSPDITEDDYTSEELIIILNPQDKNYTLNITGIGKGYYSLSVGQIYSEKVFWHDYLNQVNESDQFVFDIDPGNPQENPLIQTKAQLKNSLTVAIDEFEKEIRESPIKSSHQKVLINFLEKIRKEANSLGSLRQLSYLNPLSSLRNLLTTFEKSGFIDSELTMTFRKKASTVTGLLELLAFQNPGKVSKSQATVSIKGTEEVKGSIVIDNLTKGGALIYLEAQGKLEKANEALGKGEYWQAWIYSQEAKDLFLEAGKIL